MSASAEHYHDKYDLAIIGAGIYGIQAARTYLEIHPSRRVLILEASACLGGVWSRGKSQYASQ